MKLIPCILAGLLIAAPAFAQQKAAGKADSKADTKAIRDMAEANMAEVEAGRMAAQKAQSEDVKKFAQHMVDEHGKMLEDVRKLAEQKGVELPKSPKAKDKATMAKLEHASSARFDQAYMDDMVRDHRKDVKEVEKIASSAKDPDVKAAAQDALAHIREHLQMAEQIAKGRSGKASTGR